MDQSSDGPAMPEGELIASFRRMEAMPLMPPEEGEAVIFGQSRPTAPAMIEAAPPSQPVTPAPAAATEHDADAFLFEPEAEPDPAGFLLGPAPPAAPPPPTRPLIAPTPPPVPKPRKPPPKPAAPPEPLAPLKALTTAEKLALFG
jgi:hypothetical protein